MSFPSSVTILHHFHSEALEALEALEAVLPLMFEGLKTLGITLREAKRRDGWGRLRLRLRFGGFGFF